MSLARKMMRHGSVVVAPGVTTKRTRERAIKRGTPYRRLIPTVHAAVHATKGRAHDAATLDYRTKLILERLGIPQEIGVA